MEDKTKSRRKAAPKRSTKAPAKIEDVARHAGVSIMTVSRAMRGVEGVSAKKRAEILRLAKRLNYQPSSVAGSLAAANSTLIGVSVPTLFEAVFAEIFDGMRATFANAGLQTVMDTTEYDKTHEQSWVDRMISWRPAGIILSGAEHSEHTRSRIRAAGIPALEIWDFTEDPIDLCVGVDHRAAGLEMGEHLVKLGYRRPAYIGVEQGRDVRAESRLDGLRSAFESPGLSVQRGVRASKQASFEAGFKGVQSLLSDTAPAPDVIYFLNDHMAFGGLMACERAGLRVPRDIGIVGFNGLNINKVLDKPITTSLTHRSLMGETGAKMLVAKILGAKTERTVALPVDLQDGETTRRQ